MSPKLDRRSLMRNGLGAVAAALLPAKVAATPAHAVAPARPPYPADPAFAAWAGAFMEKMRDIMSLPGPQLGAELGNIEGRCMTIKGEGWRLIASDGDSHERMITFMGDTRFGAFEMMLSQMLITQTHMGGSAR